MLSYLNVITGQGHVEEPGKVSPEVVHYTQYIVYTLTVPRVVYCTIRTLTHILLDFSKCHFMPLLVSCQHC